MIKIKNWRSLFIIMLTVFFSFGVTGACDSGKKAIDDLTGNRAVKQYHKSKKDIEKIVDQHAERYENILDEDEE